MTERQNTIIYRLIALISSLALASSGLCGWMIKNNYETTQELIQRVSIVETRQGYPSEPPVWLLQRLDSIDKKLDRLETKIDSQ